MTKTFLKWAVLLFTALTFSVSFVSCDEDDKPIDPENPENPDNPDKPDQPGQFTFILNEKNVEIPAEGGAGKVTYTLENPVEGEKVQVTNEAEWLKDFSVETPNEINFTVAANDSYEPRVADVKVKYSTKETLFTVRQLGQKMPDQDKFNIEIKDITETQYTVIITPFDNSFSYASNVLTKDVYEKYESDEDLIIDDLEWYEYLASLNNLSIEDILRQVLHTGVYDERMQENLANTEYVYFAYGLTYDGEPTTEVYVEHFKTNEVTMVETDFDITVTDVKKGYATVNVVPDRNDISYYYDIMSKKDYDALLKTSSLEQYTQAFLTDVMRKAYLFDQTWEQALQEVVTAGPDSFTYEGVISNDKCIAYAMAVDAEGQVCSTPKVIEWETYQMEMSGNQITGTVIEVGANKCTIQWETTNNDPYCVVYALTSRFEEMSEQEKFDLIIDFFSKDVILSGDQVFTQNWLEPETAYSFFAFGWDGELTTETITQVDVVTTAGSDPSQLTFEFEVSNLTYNSATIGCTATPEDAGYIMGLASARATDSDIKTILDQQYQYLKSIGQVKDYADFIAKNTLRGRSSSTFEIFQSLEYKAYAVGVYPENGEFATKIFWSEPFTAPDGIRSQVPVEVEHDKYYDADVVFDAFPNSYAKNVERGKFALLPTTTVIHSEESSDPANTYFYKWTAIMPTAALEGYSDMEIVYSITSPVGGSRVSLYNEWYLELDQDLTILAVAAEWGTNYTPLYRENIRLTKAGASALGDFIPDEIKNPMTATKFDAMTMMNPFIQREFHLAKGVSKDNVDRLSGRINTADAVEQEDATVFTTPSVQKKQSRMKSIASTVEFNGRMLNSAEKAALK